VGTFEVSVNVGGADNMVPVTAMVDTGSIHSMMPESLLIQLNVTPLERLRYTLADGRQAEYDYGMARFGINSINAPERYCPVIFGPDNEYLLGATTLEIFNLTVDPAEGKLLPKVYRARPI
jgi:predicted aspartyl protease